MINSDSIVAIIPARKGSKGFKEKNKALLNGKPLIEYTITQAKNSKFIDEIIISSDDEEILEIARKLDSKSINRPSQYALDTTPMKDVVIHVLDELERSLLNFDIFVLLQPTSPLRTTEDIDNSIRMLYGTENHSCVSVCEFQPHPFLAVIKDGKRIKKYFEESNKYTRRQDYPEIYRINGAIYTVFTKKFMENPVFVDENNSIYLEMSIANSIDIDTEIDLLLAELVMKK